MSLHISNFTSLLLWRWHTGETWTVPQPVLDHFVDGCIFARLTPMFFQGESFCLPKCFWSLCRTSCLPQCSHMCSHCYSKHLADSIAPVAPGRAWCDRLPKHQTESEQPACQQLVFDTNDCGLSYPVSHPLAISAQSVYLQPLKERSSEFFSATARSWSGQQKMKSPL